LSSWWNDAPRERSNPEGTSESYEAVQWRLKRALSSIAAARAEEERKGSQARHRAQLWELARASSAAALRALVDLAGAPGTLAAPVNSNNGNDGLDPVLGLIEVQDLLGGELIVLLNQTGYRPPPPAVELVFDVSNAVALAYERVARHRRHGNYQREFDAALLKLYNLATYLEGLKGKSQKKVRRAVSPFTVGWRR
jgi:hypothetical protein